MCNVENVIDVLKGCVAFVTLTTFASFTYFSLMFKFYTPWKRQKTFDFLTFLGGIEMEHLSKIG